MATYFYSVQVLLRWPGLSWLKNHCSWCSVWWATPRINLVLKASYSVLLRGVYDDHVSSWKCCFLAREGVSVCFLVGGLEHLDDFSIQLGISSSHLTNSIIFQRGRVETTNEFQSTVKWCEIVVWAVMRATFYQRVSKVDQVKPPIRHSPQGELH